MLDLLALGKLRRFMMRYVLPRQVNSLAKLRGYFFGLACLHCIALLSSLGEGVVGGFLILEYQKSSPTHHTLTQLRTVELVIRNYPHTQS